MVTASSPTRHLHHRAPPAGAWGQAWSMAQTALGRRDQRTQALRDVVTDLINTRDGATYILTSIAGLR